MNLKPNFLKKISSPVQKAFASSLDVLTLSQAKNVNHEDAVNSIITLCAQLLKTSGDKQFEHIQAIRTYLKENFGEEKSPDIFWSKQLQSIDQAGYK